MEGKQESLTFDEDTETRLQDKRDTLLTSTGIIRNRLNTELGRRYAEVKQSNDALNTANDETTRAARRWFIRSLWVAGIAAVLVVLSVVLGVVWR